VRRGTAITLAVLFVLIVVAMIAQLNQKAPSSPYPGPVSGTSVPTATTGP
jgi:hypothetical protein